LQFHYTGAADKIQVDNADFHKFLTNTLRSLRGLSKNSALVSKNNRNLQRKNRKSPKHVAVVVK